MESCCVVPVSLMSKLISNLKSSCLSLSSSWDYQSVSLYPAVTRSEPWYINIFTCLMWSCVFDSPTFLHRKSIHHSYLWMSQNWSFFLNSEDTFYPLEYVRIYVSPSHNTSFVCMYTYFLIWSLDWYALKWYLLSVAWSHLVWEKNGFFTCQCSVSLHQFGGSVVHDGVRWKQNHPRYLIFRIWKPRALGEKEVFCLHSMPTPITSSTRDRNIKSSRDGCFQMLLILYQLHESLR